MIKSKTALYLHAPEMCVLARRVGELCRHTHTQTHLLPHPRFWVRPYTLHIVQFRIVVIVEARGGQTTKPCRRRTHTCGRSLMRCAQAPHLLHQTACRPPASTSFFDPPMSSSSSLHDSEGEAGVSGGCASGCRPW